MVSKEAIEAQREHPVAFWSLLVAMLAPAVAGVTGLGLLAKHLFPTPTQLVILAGAGVFILAIAPLMLVGAFGWLMVARRFVSRPVVRAWFICPGFGLLSRVSRWMFVCVYGKDDAPRRVMPGD
ncbi:MAG: hypothetical protein FJ395_02245 [Verrucomicrobia bacterium]|nr:hypothetical protein [Verrucomicrobiota bacterium]